MYCGGCRTGRAALEVSVVGQQSDERSLTLGLIVNPIAGIGGPVALRGSDGVDLQAKARTLGGQSQALARARQFIAQLKSELTRQELHTLSWLTCAGEMGAACLKEVGWNFETITLARGSDVGTSTPQDTRQAAERMVPGVDLLVFVGGDGTARDIALSVSDQTLVLGIPAGVKMHSGVFAVTPRLGAQVVVGILRGQFLQRIQREVRDYDEQADDLSLRTYGYLAVPEAAGFVQQTKVGGKESEPLALTEICADVLERVDELAADTTLVLGAGSSVFSIKQALAMPATLRGVDLRTADGEFESDVTASRLERLVRESTRVHLVVSFTRVQGFLFGRGNQQLSASFLTHLDWPLDVTVIGTRTKLLSLEGAPLLVDTGNDSLDRTLSGVVDVVCGYEERLLYRVAGGLSND